MPSLSVNSFLLCASTFFLLLGNLQASSIERIWLSHTTTQPEAITVNWETETASDSIVDYGFTESLGQTVTQTEKVMLHHVSIPLAEKDRVYHYRVRSSSDSSTIATFKGYPSKQLRVVVVGDWGYSKVKDFSAILKDDPQLPFSILPPTWKGDIAYRRVKLNFQKVANLLPTGGKLT